MLTVKTLPTKMRRDSGGFTLIELLTVILVIGILAAIGMAKLGNTKQRSQIAVLQSDLRNLATAQENYFAENLSYTGVTANLEFNQSENVTISIPVADVKGWRATASHGSVPGRECEMYYGTAAGATIASGEAVVECS